ncbi:Noc2p family-domain-containing protein [Mucor mucedo]|uniref:Noc2p family-domain-containing protein n=1 Tax=Mucor mucedo TaxID=29922 RepID=UPI002220734D|nr:Noc2p family-domain-containing protein [Mucor mucedo]KAI7894032.1 Noc2p family-domain-containing protein [Mucor mucedo]
MSPAVQKRSKNAKKQQLKPQGKKIAKIVEQAAGKAKKGTKKAVKQLSEEEDSPMEDVSESDEDDVFKKLQKVMDNDDSEADEEKENDISEKEEDAENSDDELPSDFEREMAMDSDEEEVDEDDDDEETPDKLNKDIDQHKKELEELKERDPEFYEFLQKEDGDLLGFGESDDGEDMPDASDDDDGQEYSDMEEPEETIVDDVPVLTKAMLNEWTAAVKSNNDFKAFKKILSAFKTAARMSEEDDKITFSYKIEDPTVFSKVITTTLRLAPVVFAHHLKPKKENGSPVTSGKWAFFKSYVKSYLNNLLHLLSNLTDADMLRMTIREAEKATSLFVCFDRLVKDYLKTLLNSWSHLGSVDTVRMQAFLSIKSLALATVPATKDTKTKVQGYLDLCLKNVYLTFIKNCKNTNLHTLPVINLMRNLAVQLYGINPVLSYQQGFVYIRQLAIHLRQAMKVRSTKNHNMVYNWQYIHCIDFWADVLNAYAVPMVDEDGDVVESPLKALIYPLTQVAVGVIQLIPTAQFYPLRFHVLRSLNSLIHNTNVFVPLATYVLEVLEGTVAMEKAKQSSGLPTEWDLVLKVHKKSIHGRMYQDEVLDQCAKALKSYYKEYSHHISFPEMVDADIIAIKRFVKQSKSIKGKDKLSKLAKELEAKATFVRQQRAKINFSPENEAEVEKFNKELKAKMT